MRTPLLLLTALLTGAAAGWTTPMEGLEVIEVDFDPPRQPVLSTHLDKMVLVKPGEPLSAEKVRQSIHNLFATGRYDNIEVDAEPREGGVKVIFRTRGSWFVGLVRVTGVKAPPSEAQLVNATGLDVGELYTTDKVARARERLRGLLADNGYYLAQVGRAEHRHTETQQIDVVFEVTSGLRASFGEIFVTGSTTWDPKRLRQVAGWRKGSQFNSIRVRKGIQRIEQAFHGEDRWRVEARVAGVVHNPDDNLVDLVVHISVGPRVLITVEGADFSQKQLRKYLPIYEEGVVDQDLLAEGANNLKNYLQTKGFFSAEVSYSIERDTEREVRVAYTVDRGRRQQVSFVSIRGYFFFDLDTIQERMLIQQKSLQFRRGRFSRSLLEADKDAIRELYLANGFRDVSVEDEVVTNYGGREGRLGVRLVIEEGEPTFVEDVQIEGLEYFSAEEYLGSLASAPGQPFSEVNVATDRDLILADYFNAGFQDARFEWTQEPGTEPKSIRLVYRVREGQPVAVRRPIVTGLQNTDPDVVEREIRIVPGEPISQNAMFETQRRLYDLGVFSKVDVALQNPEGNEPSKNILLQLEESRRWLVGFGGGAEFARIGGNTADVTSPVGDASFSPRVTFELTRLNVRGRAHTMTFRTRLSDLQQRALFTYEAPRWFGSDRWRMTLSGLVDESRNVRTFTGTRQEAAFQLRQRLSKPTSVLYRYIYRRSTIDEATLQISPDLIPLTSRPVRVGLLAATYLQDRRDDPTDSTRGVFNSLDLGWATGLWGSQADFFRLLGQNSSYHRLGKRLVVARSFRLGVMLPAGPFDPSLPAPTEPQELVSMPDPRIPLTERFFGGGANSHRGFPVNQAGPRDATTGFPIGGGALLINSVEVRFPLVGENIGGVLFHDAGNIYSRPGDIGLSSRQDPVIVGGEVVGYDFDYLVHAVGLGVRYRTPIGPVRVDLGYSVNPPRFIGFEGTREELLAGRGTIRPQRISHFQFHFSLGQTF